MCAYNPGVSYDPSPIYQGLTNLAQGLVAGIEAKRKKQQEADQQEQALGFIRKIAPAINPELGGMNDKTLKEGIKSVGAGNVLKYAQDLTEAAERKQQAALQRQQIEQALAAQRSALIRQERNRTALQRAADPRTAAVADAMLSGQPYDLLNQPARGDPGQDYIAAGGDDPEHMQALNGMARLALLRQPPAGPGSMGYGALEVPGVGQMVVDRATGEPVDSGKLIRPDRKTDEKALTQTEIQQIGALQQSSRDLAALEAAFNEMGDEHFGGPVSGRLKALDPTNVNVSRIENLVTAATPNLARGVFREVGVLTDTDVARYQKLLPNVNDTAAQRKQKFADLRARLSATSKETLGTLKSAGRDVAGLEERLFAATPAAPADAAAGIVEITAPEEFAALPPGRKFRYQGRVGVKRASSSTP